MGDQPLLVVFTEHRGRYRLEFDYDPDMIALLKKTVPGPMRHWDSQAKRWEISIDWIGPLAGAFVNAGIEVLGLDETNIADWFGCFAAETPTSEEGCRAYRKGLCKTCCAMPHRPGGTECEECFHQRLVAQHRVKAALAEAGATPYPEALAAVGSARTTRYPLEIDRSDVAIVKRDYSVIVDILIAAEYDQSTTCLICGRRPPKGDAHATCRTRLLHALDEGRAFSRARNRAFQEGNCTVCRIRPRLSGAVACAHCARLVDACRSWSPTQ
jgi:hypothetical protein